MANQVKLHVQISGGSNDLRSCLASELCALLDSLHVSYEWTGPWSDSQEHHEDLLDGLKDDAHVRVDSR